MPSLNDDVCEPFAPKTLITHVAVVSVKTNLLYLSFNKSIDITTNAFQHGKYEINVCWIGGP